MRYDWICSRYLNVLENETFLEIENFSLILYPDYAIRMVRKTEIAYIYWVNFVIKNLASEWNRAGCSNNIEHSVYLKFESSGFFVDSSKKSGELVWKKKSDL